MAISLIVALKKLHSNGIIHGDLKPENIVTNCLPVDAPFLFEKLAIIDFGLSCSYLKNGSETEHIEKKK